MAPGGPLPPQTVSDKNGNSLSKVPNLFKRTEPPLSCQGSSLKSSNTSGSYCIRTVSDIALSVRMFLISLSIFRDQLAYRRDTATVPFQ